MERLKMQLVEEIIHRLRSDQSERSIVADLGVARGTIRRYGQWAEERGFLDPTRPMPSPEEYTGGPFAAQQRSSNVSSVEPFRAIVLAQLDAGAEAKAIHQRLRDSHGYTGDYSSVRRFVRVCVPAGRPWWCASRRCLASRLRWILAGSARYTILSRRSYALLIAS